MCFIQFLSFLDQRKDKIQILERSLGFIKIHFQAEDSYVWYNRDGGYNCEDSFEQTLDWKLSKLEFIHKIIF